jgi:hypothetical protein
MKKKAIFRAMAVASVLLGCAGPLPAQWITQSFNRQPGWNPVHLHVDASYATLRDLVATDVNNPIEEVWLWQPAPTTLQFIESPQVPTGSSSQWLSWLRTVPLTSPLQRLVANTAYLVRVGTNVTSYTWNLKRKPVPPRYLWTTTGLNFLGFPACEEPAPSFEAFLTPAPDLLHNGQFFRYLGGELGPGNPARLYAFRTTPLRRGEAFWVRAGHVFNRYSGPFELDLQSPQGVHFRDILGQHQLRLRNLAATDLTVTLRLQASEPPPAGEPAIVGTPKPQLKQFEAQLLEKDNWTELQAGVEVKLAPHPNGGADEQYVLCRSSARRQKEAAMMALARQGLRAQLDKTPAALQKHPAREPGLIERRIGRWLGRFPAAERWLTVTVERNVAGQASGLKVTEHAHGAYRLRPNCPGKDPAKLWRWYMQLSQAGDAFRIGKSDLSLRPVFHQKTERVEAHILVCFLTLALWRPLEMWRRAKALGNCCRQLSKEVATVRSMDVVLPVKQTESQEKGEVRRRVAARPARPAAELLGRLGRELPGAPKIVQNVVEKNG